MMDTMRASAASMFALVPGAHNTHGQLSVGAVGATALTIPANVHQVILVNDGNEKVYLSVDGGDAEVATHLPIAAGATFSFKVSDPSDAGLSLISASGTQTVAYLLVGVPT